MPGAISANGSAVLIDNNVTLTASNLPLNESGYFLAGPGQGTAMPAASVGIFCLVGGAPSLLGRYDDPLEIIDSGATGTGSLTIDVNNVPIAGGPDPTGPFTRALQPGETWNFQCWYRDNDPGPTSNFTDAVSVVFQ